MSEKKQKLNLQELDEEQILEYFADHPDFFDRHPEVMENLCLPKGGVVGNVAILAEKQAKLLHNRHQKLETNFKRVVKNAAENEKRGICLHRLALHLTMHEYNGRAHVAQSALTVLRKELPMNITNIITFDNATGDDARKGVGDPRLNGLVNSLFVDNKPDCGPFDPAIKAALFGTLSKRVASAVAMPLSHPASVGRDHAERLGVLVFGSTSADSFKAGKGTMFLVQCAELIVATMARYSD